MGSLPPFFYLLKLPKNKEPLDPWGLSGGGFPLTHKNLVKLLVKTFKNLKIGWCSGFLRRSLMKVASSGDRVPCLFGHCFE